MRRATLAHPNPDPDPDPDPDPNPNPDPAQARVGLLPKRREEGEEGNAQRRRRREGCAARPQCIGQQHYTAATNMCEPPKCAARYLRAYDAASGTCLLSPSFEALALVLLVAFALAELTLQAHPNPNPNPNPSPNPNPNPNPHPAGVAHAAASLLGAVGGGGARWAGRPRGGGGAA